MIISVRDGVAMMSEYFALFLGAVECKEGAVTLREKQQL